MRQRRIQAVCSRNYYFGSLMPKQKAATRESSRFLRWEILGDLGAMEVMGDLGILVILVILGKLSLKSRSYATE